MKTFYEILEISPSATEAEIKEQYRFLIQAWHPDKFPNPAQKAKALEKAKEINQAFEVLGKPEKRKQYDRELVQAGLKAQPHGSSAGSPPAPQRPAQSYYSQAQSSTQRERPQYRRTESAPNPRPGISPLADFKWLLLYGDEYTYELDDREAEALHGGEFQYRVSDWPTGDRPDARLSWQGRGYQVEILKSPCRLIAGEASRVVTGRASLTSVTITLDRGAQTNAFFGLLLNLAYLGANPEDSRLYPGMQGKSIPNSYYSFCLNTAGEWEFRDHQRREGELGTLVERGVSYKVPELIQRGHPLEVCAVIRDSPPPDNNKVRVRLGINSALVCDTFAFGRAIRRGGVIVDSRAATNPGDTPRITFSDFQSYFLAQR